MNIKLFFTISLVIVTFRFCNSQSVIYSPTGKLLVDSTYSITKDALDLFSPNEMAILGSLYNSLEYPQFFIENAVEGLIIVKIDVGFESDKIGIKIVKSCEDQMNQMITQSFIKKNDKLIQLLKPKKGKYTYYIPILFKLNLNHFSESLLKNRSITIESNGFAKEIERMDH